MNVMNPHMNSIKLAISMRHDTTGRDHVKREGKGQFDSREIPYENTVMVENREHQVLATKPIITTKVNVGKVLE